MHAALWEVWNGGYVVFLFCKFIDWAFMQKVIKQTEFKCIIKTCNTACVVVIVAHYLEYELKNIFRVLRSDTGRILFAQLFLSLNISYLISQVITAVNLSCAQHTVPNTHTHTYIGTMKGGADGSHQWYCCQKGCPHIMPNGKRECIRKETDAYSISHHAAIEQLHRKI